MIQFSVLELSEIMNAGIKKQEQTATSRQLIVLLFMYAHICVRMHMHTHARTHTCAHTQAHTNTADSPAWFSNILTGSQGNRLYFSSFLFYFSIAMSPFPPDFSAYSRNDTPNPWSDIR